MKVELAKKVSLRYNSKVILKHKTRVVQFPVSEIAYILTQGAYTQLRCINGKKTLITRRINVWEKILPKKYFYRVDRFQIINLNCVNEVMREAINLTRVSILGLSEPILIKRVGTERLKAALLRRFNV